MKNLQSTLQNVILLLLDDIKQRVVLYIVLLKVVIYTCLFRRVLLGKKWV